MLLWLNWGLNQRPSSSATRLDATPPPQLMVYLLFTHLLFHKQMKTMMANLSCEHILCELNISQYVPSTPPLSTQYGEQYFVLREAEQTAVCMPPWDQHLMCGLLKLQCIIIAIFWSFVSVTNRREHICESGLVHSGEGFCCFVIYYFALCYITAKYILNSAQIPK